MSYKWKPSKSQRNEKIHHDYIHIVNEYIRNKNF